MKKITLNLAIAATFLCSSLSIAQTIPTVTNNTQKTLSVQNVSYELTDATKDCIENTGFARCLTDEYEIALQKANPSRSTEAQFEKWLKPHLDKIKADRAAGKLVAPIYNIPVVIHIVHNGDAVGSGENITDAQALSQIQVLNEDFQRLAGTPGGANTTGLAVDVQINFCMAQQDETGNPTTGIVRHNITPYNDNVANGAGGADWETMADVEQMKTVTGWDPDRYLNMWTIRPGGLSLQNGGLSGLLGYAQFPNNSGLGGLNANNGNANTDGVVAGFDAMGTIAEDDGTFVLNATYNLGRTMTHEVGHWVGLRHIWGDGPNSGSCGVDDFCADTPNAAQPNYSCNTTNASCTGGVFDQVQNYMDYTNDACMDTFTQDQKDRVLAVMMNSPRRGILNNSNACNAAAPYISFANITRSESELTDCSASDYLIEFNIGLAASQNATVNITVEGTGTATNGEDFQLINNSVTFNAGSTASQSATLRVFNDGFVEGNETIDLSFTVNPNGGDAIADTFRDEMTFTIVDEDEIPLSNQTNTILTHDFENLTDYDLYDVDGDTNVFGVVNGLDGYGAISGRCGFSETDLTVLGGTGNTNPDNYMASPQFTIPVDASSVLLTFTEGSFAPNGNATTNYREHYSVYFTTADPIGTTGDLQQQTIINDREITAAGAAGVITIQVDITAFAGQTGKLIFRHHNSDNANGLLLIDNLNVEATVGKDVHTTVNTGTTGPSLPINTNGGTAYTADLTSSGLILDITNNNSFDYGCVDVSVSRAGTGAQSYNGSTGADNVMDKTFTITPDNTNTSGDVTVDFYFTNDEVNGWITATGNTQGDLAVRRVGASTSEFKTLTITDFGTSAKKATATFTQGMEGTYYFGRAASLSVSNNTIESLSIYPNPATNELNIGFESNGSDVQLSLFDIRGRRVLSTNKANTSNKFQTQLNVSSLESGVYLLNISDSSLNVTKKIAIK